jgi:hypothetical protein
MSDDKVTLADVYRQLGSLDAKVDAIKETQEQFLNEQRSHRRRLRSLELTRARSLGWVAGLSLAISVAWTVLGDKLKTLF